MMKSTMKTKKRIFAISIEVPARTPKPKMPAINAMTRKVMAQFNMMCWCFVLVFQGFHRSRRFGELLVVAVYLCPCCASSAAPEVDFDWRMSELLRSATLDTLNCADGRAVKGCRAS